MTGHGWDRKGRSFFLNLFLLLANLIKNNEDSTYNTVQTSHNNKTTKEKTKQKRKKRKNKIKIKQNKTKTDPLH